MLTDLKIETNQKNARKSTGPRTEEGKAKSSRNAMKCGVHSMATLLETEDAGERKALEEGMIASLNPLNAHEAELVNMLVDLEWRLRRVSRQETKILDAEIPDYKALNNLSLHGARLKRQYSATLKEFIEVHKTFRDFWARQMEDAVKVITADRIYKRPSTFSNFGFVFTEQQAMHEMCRNKAIADAWEAVETYDGDNIWTEEPAA